MALDVHQATLVVSVRDEQGSVVMRATVATEAKAIVALVRGLGSRVHIAFEEGTQAQSLHDVLTKHAAGSKAAARLEDPEEGVAGTELRCHPLGGAGLSENRGTL